MIRTLYLGTNEYAAQILDYLVKKDENYQINAVVTTPDTVNPYNKKVSESFVKLKAADLNLKLYQPEKLKLATKEILDTEKPELIIVCGYGKFLNEEILNYPKYKCVNIHASLLPKLRGAVPIEAAIALGFTETGVTLQIMQKEMDKGDIIASEVVKIDELDDFFSLREKLVQSTKNLLFADLPLFTSDNPSITPRMQKEEEATYCYVQDVNNQNSLVNFNEEYKTISRKIRAYCGSIPGWFNSMRIVKAEIKDKTYLNFEKAIEINKNVKIYNASFQSKDIFEEEAVKMQNGDAFIENGHLFIKCKNGFVDLNEIQVEGAKKMHASEFVNGLINKLK